jgi:hypothetical protein
MKRCLWVGLVFVASLSCAGFSVADDLLRIDGRTVKWAPATFGPDTVITYTTLTRPFSLPDNKRTISADNCGTMGAFDEIVAASANLTEARLREELRSAFASWEHAAGVKFVEVDDVRRASIVIGATIASNGPAFANLSLDGGFEKQPVANVLGIGSGTMAVRGDNTARNEPAATIEQAYVCLNQKQAWKIGFDGNLHAYDLRHTFMHEVGHAIGLDHPGSSGAIMGYRYDEQVHELQPSDIAAAQQLYGSARATNSLEARPLKP